MYRIPWPVYITSKARNFCYLSFDSPEGASTSNRMLYASSATLLFQEAGITGKVFDLQDSDDLTDDWLTAKLESSKTRP